MWGKFGEDVLVQEGAGGGAKNGCDEGGGHGGKVHIAKVEGKEEQEEALSELPKQGRWVTEDTYVQSQAAETGAHSLSEDSRGRGKPDRRLSLVEEDNLEHCMKCTVPLLQVANCRLCAQVLVQTPQFSPLPPHQRH